jgi:hypothetical protein
MRSCQTQQQVHHEILRWPTATDPNTLLYSCLACHSWAASPPVLAHPVILHPPDRLLTRRADPLPIATPPQTTPLMPGGKDQREKPDIVLAPFAGAHPLPAFAPSLLAGIAPPHLASDRQMIRPALPPCSIPFTRVRAAVIERSPAPVCRFIPYPSHCGTTTSFLVDFSHTSSTSDRCFRVCLTGPDPEGSATSGCCTFSGTSLPPSCSR